MAPADERTWLQDRLAQYQRDEVNWEAAREALDNDEIRPLRPLFRGLINDILQAPTLQAKNEAAQRALTVLAATSSHEHPVQSTAKHIHEVTRRFGSEAAQTLRRHIADLEDRLKLV